jgi:hypothetical protein
MFSAWFVSLLSTGLFYRAPEDVIVLLLSIIFSNQEYAKTFIVVVGMFYMRSINVVLAVY